MPASVAYLGPQGTYGHQAAKRFISELNLGSTTTVPCPSISDVYTNTSEYLVLPLQNVIHGSVTETVDSLLSPLSPPTPSYSEEAEAGPSRSRNRTNTSRERPMIIADLDLPIRHGLVVRKGVNMEDIRWVRSHEQALGQSSIFLKTHLPQAKLRPWPSTAGAALSLLPRPSQTGNNGESSSDEHTNRGINGDPAPETVADAQEDVGEGAAICSASVVMDHSELEVLYEGTQSIDNNFTRFLLLSRRHTPSSSQPSSSPDSMSYPSQHPPLRRSHFYTMRHASHLSRFPPKALSRIIGIHTRPYPVHPPPSRQPDTSHTDYSRASGQNGKDIRSDGFLDGDKGEIRDEPRAIEEGLYRTLTLIEISASEEERMNSEDNDERHLGFELGIAEGVKGEEGVLYLGTATHLP